MPHLKKRKGLQRFFLKKSRGIKELVGPLRKRGENLKRVNSIRRRAAGEKGARRRLSKKE